MCSVSWLFCSDLWCVDGDVKPYSLTSEPKIVILNMEGIMQCLLSVCFCEQDNWNHFGRIWVKFSGLIFLVTRTKWLDFDRLICGGWAPETNFWPMYTFISFDVDVYVIERSVITLHFPFIALTLLGDRKGIRPVKSWVLVCWWWRFDWSFARLVAPVAIFQVNLG